MPRLSNLEIQLNSAKKDLISIQKRMDPRTFASYIRKINSTSRKDVAKKLADEIRLIKNKPAPQKPLTTANIKKQAKANIELQRAVVAPRVLASAPLTKPARVNVLRNITQPTARQVLNRQPKFVKQTLIDRVRFFTKYDFHYINIRTEEQFYNAIRNAITRFPQATSVSIHLKHIEGANRVRSISLTANDLATYDEFKEALNRIVQGNFVGSDAVNLAEDEIIYDHFALASAVIAGNGSSDKMIFEVEGIEESKRQVGKKTMGNKDCGKICLTKLVEEGSDAMIELQSKNSSEFRTMDGLVKFIKDWELPINVMANSFLLKKVHSEIVNNGEMKRIIIKDKKGNEKKYVCSKMDIGEDVEIVYFNLNYKATSTIIFDEFNEHFDIIKNNVIKMYDNIYLSSCCRVIKDDVILFSPRQANINNKAIKEVELRYLFFDYETVIDFEKSSCMQEYSLSVLNLNNSQLELLTKADDEKNEKTVAEIRKHQCMTFLGFDCSIQFIKWVLEHQMDTAFVFVGFNNANFDNFILLDSLLRYNEVNTEFSIGDIFYNGSQLLDFYVSGRHNTFDIHKHLMGSLKANCDSFKINCCAKKSFDHNKAQQLHLEGKLIEFITDNDELKEYNEYDVLATAVLFCKYRRALSEIPATKPYAPLLHSIKTIGSLIYKVFDASKATKKFDLPKLSFEQYTDLQKSKIAGRVELFNGIQKVEERLVSTDVCSLYPYVMSVAPVYYPCGKMINTDKYMGPDTIGFYYCDIDQSNLRASNLPKIYARKTAIENDWGHEVVLENYLISNVMIELLKKYNCGVVIKNGFYFTEKKKSCDMFDFLLDFMKAKNEQDTKKKNKDDTYNSALRETLKLLMNSLSGKVIEGLHTEKTQDVNSVAEYEKLKDKSRSINFINAIGNKIFITYEVDAETIINKQRPIYLGVLIYDYAKSYMYENSYSKVGLDQLLYTDTDASKFRYSKFMSWKRWVDDNNIQVPHHPEVELIDERYKNHKIYQSDSKVFGSFEDELEEMVGEKYTFYCVEKKSWCYAVDGKSKFRFKGLNGSALLLSLGEDFVEQKTIKHKAKGGKEAWEEVKYQIAENTELEVYNFAQNNKHLAIEAKNELNFFERIYTTGEAYLLCNSFRKIVKNSAHNVVLGDDDRYNNLMNKVQVNYMMKHINLYKK
jgi:hypothetical protein